MEATVVMVGTLSQSTTSKSYLKVNGTATSYAHIVYHRCGIAPSQCSGHFQTLIAETYSRDGTMDDPNEGEGARGVREEHSLRRAGGAGEAANDGRVGQCIAGL